jgi:RND family efflux transporter MFP subunit
MELRKRIRNVLSSNRTFPAITCSIAILAVLITSCSKEEEKVPEKKVVRPVKIMTVTSSGEALKRKFPGRVRAAKRVDLAFQVGGTLIKLPVDEGQEVKKGQLVARVHPKDFQTDLRNAEGQLAKAKAALQLAQTEYERVVRIRKKDPGAVSQAMVDRRREAVNKAQADIQSLQASVDAAKDQLSYTYLRAPFSGVISRRYVDNYQEVRAKQPIVSLDDISYLEILVDVPEIVMASVRKGGSTKAVAEFAAAPGRQFPLTIKEYATRADPRTQTYQVTLQMPRPKGINILPGMTATVHGSPPVEQKGDDRFVVPAIAVFADEAGTSHVWVVDKDTMKVHKRKVTSGDLTGTDSIRIIDGLRPGEMIAVAGASQLREGMQVRAMGK